MNNSSRRDAAMPRKTISPSTQTHHATLPEVGYVRLSTILQVFPVGRSSWWAGVKSGKYPASVKIGENTTAWKAEDIRALVVRLAMGRL